MIETLEDVMSHCDSLFASNPTIFVTESQISEAQKPPSRTYKFIINPLPPNNGIAEAKILHELKEKLLSDGFGADLKTGKLNGTGKHIELIVKDKYQPKFSKGEEVGFRADLSGPPTKFRVINFKWNRLTRGFDYHIENASKVGFTTVDESNLSKWS